MSTLVQSLVPLNGRNIERRAPKYGFDQTIPLLKVVILGKPPPFSKLKTEITNYYED